LSADIKGRLKKEERMVSDFLMVFGYMPAKTVF